MNYSPQTLALSGFPKAFCIANGVDLLERVAYYGMFIFITPNLSRIFAFNNVQAAWLSGSFSAGLYLLPTLSGALADRVIENKVSDKLISIIPVDNVGSQKIAEKNKMQIIRTSWYADMNGFIYGRDI